MMDSYDKSVLKRMKVENPGAYKMAINMLDYIKTKEFELEYEEDLKRISAEELLQQIGIEDIAGKRLVDLYKEGK